METYLRYLADHLELRDWRIHLADDPCDEPYVAEIKSVYGRKWATIYLSERWHELSPVQQRQTLVHELIHCHFRLVESLAEQAEMVMPRATYRLWYTNHEHGVEYAVDALAEAIAPFLDLPS